MSKKYLGDLLIETDHDFSIELNGILHTSHEINIKISSIDELNSIKIHGPFGTTVFNAKIWEIEDALNKIKANPDCFFDNTGGNRGATWYPFNN